MNSLHEGPLPSSWQVAPISDIADINPKFDRTGIDDDTEVSFVPMSAVAAESGVIDVSAQRKFRDVKKGYTGFLEGDVLVAKITPCMENGKMAIVPPLSNGAGFGSTEFHVLRPRPGVSPKYLYYLVSSKKFRFDAEHNMTGAVGQKRVPTNYLSAYVVPVPPSTEQELIIEKIDALLSELDKGIESLKTTREQLKVYRQAVLKHAFEGKLTVGWRVGNSQAPEIPKQYFARILHERQKLYKQQHDEWKISAKEWERRAREGSKPPKPKSLATLKEVAADDVADFPKLPSGWVYTRLGLLIDEPTYGTSKKCQYESGDVGVLRIPNISNGRIDATDLKYASFLDEEKANLALQNGDLLTIRSNGSVSLVGSCALITDKDTQYLFAGYLIRLRPNQTLILPSFLLAVLSSQLLRQQIESAAKSTSGVNNINTVEIQNLIVPLPSLDEQAVLLTHLESQLSSIDQTEMDLNLQLVKSDSLRQSILKKAFSGQLVLEALREGSEPQRSLSKTAPDKSAPTLKVPRKTKQ